MRLCPRDRLRVFCVNIKPTLSLTGPNCLKFTFIAHFCVQVMISQKPQLVAALSGRYVLHLHLFYYRKLQRKVKMRRCTSEQESASFVTFCFCFSEWINAAAIGDDPAGRVRNPISVWWIFVWIKLLYILSKNVFYNIKYRSTKVPTIQRWYRNGSIF